MNVSEAIQILKEKGYKYTGKRIQILEFFASRDKYLTAKDVLEYLRQSYPTISFDTVYRNLSLFSDLGILEFTELSGERHFRFSCGTERHHHHFICLDCGKTKEIEMCPMNQIYEELMGFTISGHKFEIYGYCQDCAG